MTGHELRAWRKRTFKKPLRWSVFDAAHWAGVPEERWIRWERLGKTRSVPKWLVERMDDPFLGIKQDRQSRRDEKRALWAWARVQWYNTTMPAFDIADEIGVAESTLRKHMAKHGVRRTEVALQASHHSEGR